MTYYNMRHTHHKRESWIKRLLSMTRHGFDCCVSNNRVPCERSEQNASTLTRSR
jgi:hypothetical protein